MKPALLMLAAALVAACGRGADGRVAFSQVEVQAYLEREVGRTLPGLSVAAASCPADLPTEAGGIAICTVAVEQATLRYEVQLLVGGRFEARPQRPIVTVRDITAAVQSKLGAPAAEVQCDNAAVLQPDPDHPPTCRITGAGLPRTAAVHVDAAGAITVTDT